MKTISSIVVIDDDDMSNILIKESIKYAGMTDNIRSFLYAHKALAHLKNLALNEPENYPCLILLDINMPQMSGWEFLDEYLLLPPQIINRASLFMLTASISYIDTNKAKKYSIITNYLSKPLTIDVLNEIKNNYC